MRIKFTGVWWRHWGFCGSKGWRKLFDIGLNGHFVIGPFGFQIERKI